jgi:spore coat protein CotF
MITLNQKETSLLQDQKKHEELCVKKYSSFANQAKDPQLKQLLNTLGQQEQQHLNTLNQIMSGQVPSMQSGGQQGQQQSGQQQGGQQSGGQQNTFTSTQSGAFGQNDADLCEDLLSTEKYVSATYNTAIFEFRDPAIRQALNHIQKEEQQHGEALYNYMSSKGMYQSS